MTISTGSVICWTLGWQMLRLCWLEQAWMSFIVLGVQGQSSFRCARFGRRSPMQVVVSRFIARRWLRPESDLPSFEDLPAIASHRLASPFLVVDLEENFWICWVPILTIHRLDNWNVGEPNQMTYFSVHALDAWGHNNQGQLQSDLRVFGVQLQFLFMKLV